MTVQYKKCPQCGTLSPLAAAHCPQCRRQFRTNFAPPTDRTLYAGSAPKTDPCAVLSLACGMAGLLLWPIFLGPAGFILGFFSLYRIREDRQLTGRWLAGTGFLIGLFSTVYGALLLSGILNGTPPPTSTTPAPLGPPPYGAANVPLANTPPPHAMPGTSQPGYSGD